MANPTPSFLYKHIKSCSKEFAPLLLPHTPELRAWLGVLRDPSPPGTTPLTAPLTTQFRQATIQQISPRPYYLLRSGTTRSTRRHQGISHTQAEGMGPHGGGVAGEVTEEPGRGERAPIASWGGMRRSEKAKVSEEAVRRKGGGGGPREWRMG